jgi:hypothetical protein
MLDAMVPTSILRGGIARAAAATQTSSPLRMAMFFLPNGMNMHQWTPTTEGEGFELTPTLEPLAPVRDQLTVLSGLTLDAARAHGDGGGDHARSAAAFLTGAHPHKTSGDDIHLGVSMDQVAAKEIGNRTRLQSLELGLDKGGIAGDCDSGYSCAYVSNISWSTPTTPLPHETNPAAVFDRLFGSDDDRAAAENRQRRLSERKSILDFVSDDAKSLNRQLGKRDQQKLDEFTTAIREIERRVEMARNQANSTQVPVGSKPAGTPEDFGEHMRLMADMLVLAFQMDLTRISTFLVARDGSDRTYRMVGVNEGHHTVSHHGRDEKKLEAVAKIDHFHVEQFSYFLQKMASIKEGDGTLLDHSMILFGCGISDGNRHNHNDLPIVLAGRGGGAITPGRHVRYKDGTPLCNLYLGMLNRMGVTPDRFGDSTEPLKDLQV